MRILDHRYRRDLRRHDLALRLIRHELRTANVVAWTGLSVARIRKLYRSYIPEGVLVALRHRGPAPTSVQKLLRTKNLNAEAAGLAGLCCAMGVLSLTSSSDAAQELPSLTAGERLCYAFELYQQLVPRPQISLEQLVLLVTALARGQQVALVHCTSCDGLMLVTLLYRHRRVCTHCLLLANGPPPVARDAHGTFRKLDENEAKPESAADMRKGRQRTLF